MFALTIKGLWAHKLRSRSPASPSSSAWPSWPAPWCPTDTAACRRFDSAPAEASEGSRRRRSGRLPPSNVGHGERGPRLDAAIAQNGYATVDGVDEVALRNDG